MKNYSSPSNMKVIVVKGKHFETARKEAIGELRKHIQELAIKLKEQEAI